MSGCSFSLCYACIRHGGRHAVALRLVQVHQFGFGIVSFRIGCIRSASFWCNSGTRFPCVLLDAPSGSVSAQHAFLTQCHCVIAPLLFAMVLFATLGVTRRHLGLFEYSGSALGLSFLVLNPLGSYRYYVTGATQSPRVLLDASSGSVSAQHAFVAQ